MGYDLKDFYNFLINFFSFNNALKGKKVYIPHMQSLVETSLEIPVFLICWPLRKPNVVTNIAATIVLLVLTIHEFNKSLNTTFYGPSTMLNTEDTNMSKSSSCAQKLPIHFGGRKKTNHFDGETDPLNQHL